MSVDSLRHPSQVDELFLYRLTRLAALGRVPVVRLCEREAGITRREWRLLGLLAQQPGLSSSQLAGRALLERAPTSRALGSLVAKGLVVRQPLPGNRREVRLQLTERGREAYERLLPQVAAVNRALLSALDDAAVAQLDQALTALTAQARVLAG